MAFFTSETPLHAAGKYTSEVRDNLVETFLPTYPWQWHKVALVEGNIVPLPGKNQNKALSIHQNYHLFAKCTMPRWYPLLFSWYLFHLEVVTFRPEVVTFHPNQE